MTIITDIFPDEILLGITELVEKNSKLNWGKSCRRIYQITKDLDDYKIAAFQNRFKEYFIDVPKIEYPWNNTNDVALISYLSKEGQAITGKIDRNFMNPKEFKCNDLQRKNTFKVYLQEMTEKHKNNPKELLKIYRKIGNLIKESNSLINITKRGFSIFIYLVAG